jgi:hypothetical protein
VGGRQGDRDLDVPRVIELVDGSTPASVGRRD